jgi:hypothetical protein
MRTGKFRRRSRPRNGEPGFAVIAIIALLALMLIFIGANARTLRDLGRHIKLVEKKQLVHAPVPVIGTNSVSATNLPPVTLQHGQPAREGGTGNTVSAR